MSGKGKWSAAVRAATIVTGIVLLAGAASCTAASPASAPTAQALRQGGRTAATSTAHHTASRTATAAHAAAACTPATATASLRPPPGPPQVPSDPFMAKILARGYLIAGVSQSTYKFGYVNPLTGQTEGFDIDMIHAVAQAIFGNPNKVELKGITDAQREPDIRNGSVDIVAETMTILCVRLKHVDFSSVYFEAYTRVLVLKNSTATSLANLGGQKVCTTAGADAAPIISSYPVTPRLVLVTAPQITDCLVLLQQGQVAAVSTDDNILAGLHAQDPFTKVVGPRLAPQPYGLAISQQQPNFVRFVNAVLAQYEADGGWAASYDHWVGSPAPAPPTAQYAD